MNIGEQNWRIDDHNSLLIHVSSYIWIARIQLMHCDFIAEMTHSYNFKAHDIKLIHNVDRMPRFHS